MILSKEIEITISNQGAYYKSLGYKDTKQGTKLLVKIEHLKLNSNQRVLCDCDSCGVHFDRQYQLLRKKKQHIDGIFCFSCTRKILGPKTDQTKAIARRKQDVGDKHPRWNPNKKQLASYNYRVRRLTEETYAMNKDLINPMNYPRTLCGVDGGYQLDHKVSIKRAFLMGLNPKIVASRQNLQMIPWQENRKKAHK